MKPADKKNSIRKAKLRSPELNPAVREGPVSEKDSETQPEKTTEERVLLRPSRIAVNASAAEETAQVAGEETAAEAGEETAADQRPELETRTEQKTVTEPQPQLARIIGNTLTRTEPEKEVSREKTPVKKFYVPDIPLRFSSFDESLESCRELHPSPEEMLMDQTAVQRTWLMSQLKKARTEPEIEALAYSLNYKDLSILFPVLSTVKKREEANQIQNLIRLRAGHFLYVCGWLTLQFSYPRSTVARVLADLCMILEDIAFLRTELSQKELGQIRECKVPDLGPDRILWNEIEMISEIALPNSRRFVSDIANELYKSNIDEDVFLKRYALYPNLALGKAVLEKYEEIASGMVANPMLSNAFLDRFKRGK